MRDLMIVESINKYLNERFPIYYNHLLYGGYFNMPSALMGHEGEIGLGFSYVPPYRNYNLRIELLDRVEISGNYRIFTGIDDPILSPTGFGDKSDKGANIKIALLHPEDTNFCLPGISVGWEDFTGTKGFEARYIVFTQVLPRLNLECSLGYGQKRIRKWFGGLTYIPFRTCTSSYFKDLAFVAEYDAIPYKSPKREPHPDARTKKSSINYGLKYRLWHYFDFSVCYNKGEEFAYSLAAFYNFGMTNGFFPKINNPLPYTAPRNTQCLGPLRPTDVLVQDLVYPYGDQGFELQEVWLSLDFCGNKVLRLKVYNCMWRYEDEVRNRISELVANLTPRDISEVIVTLLNDNWPVQEYRFQMEYVSKYAEKEICPYELNILTPLKEASKSCTLSSCRLFKNRLDLWNVGIFPKTYTAFGSSRGKYKYLFGVNLSIDGFISEGFYYSLLLGYSLFSNLGDVSNVDRLNPSQIINVRTDTVNYYKEERFTVDEAYIQKFWNLGCGWFGSLALGLFEEAYGGLAGEILFYPVDSNWAVGIEGAYLRKREYSGIGFTDKIRKLDGFQQTFRKYHGSQYYLDVYYNFPGLDCDVCFKAGKFLAHDWGIRSEFSRYFPSGMRLFFWYTYTDAKDYVNGHRYQDHGAGISLPLDIFYTYSSRNRWTNGISAWLRDVGAVASSGIPLYYQLRDNRERSISRFNTCWW